MEGFRSRCRCSAGTEASTTTGSPWSSTTWIVRPTGLALAADAAANRPNTAGREVDQRPDADALPRQLSGGMRQRAAIAQVLANHPRCCSSTSPSGRSTRRPGCACTSGCARCSPPATRPSSSSPTTATRRCCSATGSPAVRPAGPRRRRARRPPRPVARPLDPGRPGIRAPQGGRARPGARGVTRVDTAPPLPAQRVAPDRMISTGYPESRHAHKTTSWRQDGFHQRQVVQRSSSSATSAAPEWRCAGCRRATTARSSSAGTLGGSCGRTADRADRPGQTGSPPHC